VGIKGVEKCGNPINTLIGLISIFNPLPTSSSLLVPYSLPFPLLPSKDNQRKLNLNTPLGTDPWVFPNPGKKCLMPL
jgi:hypothetical protein